MIHTVVNVEEETNTHKRAHAHTCITELGFSGFFFFNFPAKKRAGEGEDQNHELQHWSNVANVVHFPGYDTVHEPAFSDAQLPQ